MTTDSSAIEASVGSANVSALTCGAFLPISWSSHDSDQTIRQIKAHNASYRALCPGLPQK